MRGGYQTKWLFNEVLKVSIVQLLYRLSMIALFYAKILNCIFRR